jgi:hypothetical protein
VDEQPGGAEIEGETGQLDQGQHDQGGAKLEEADGQGEAQHDAGDAHGVAADEVQMGEQDSLGKQPDEPRGDVDHHEPVGEAGLGLEAGGQRVKVEQEGQRRPQDQGGGADHQVEARAAADHLVGLHRVALRDVAREVPDAGHGDAERHQAHVAGERRDQRPGPVSFRSERPDEKGGEDVGRGDRHQRDDPRTSDVA